MRHFAPDRGPVLAVSRPPDGTSPRRRTTRALGVLIAALALLVSLLGVMAAQGTPAAAATWQLSGNLGAHDPTIMHEGDTWWVATTGTGIPMKYSPDGHHWTQGVPIFRSELPWWRTYAPDMGTNDVWAPDMHAFHGRVWMYYAVSSFGTNQSAIGLVSAPTIASGQWRDDGLVLSSAPGRTSYNAIDPSLVIDSAGAPWLVFGSWFSGIYVTRLDPTTMKPTGGLTRIAARSGGIEGPNIVYRGGYYYLFASIDRCCEGVNSTYKIAYGRSRSITGPYVDAGGASMLNGGGTVLESTHGNIIGPGGQSVIQNDSGWLIIRHYYDGNNNGAPTMLISDLYFDAAGWPTYDAGASSPPPTSPPPTTSPPSGGGASCRVSYQVTNQWPGGFGASVTVTNTGSAAVDGWSLGWSFPDGQRISQVWGATATDPGPAATVRNVSYDADIGANGGSVSFGFNGSWGSANGSPTAFSLNGHACTSG